MVLYISGPYTHARPNIDYNSFIIICRNSKILVRYILKNKLLFKFKKSTN